MAAVELEAGALVAAVVAAEEEEGAELTTVSTRTPACPTCSRALSKNTWTRFTSGRVTWPGPGTEADQDTGPTLTTTPTRTHTPTHTGSHQPT